MTGKPPSIGLPVCRRLNVCRLGSSYRVEALAGHLVAGPDRILDDSADCPFALA